MVSGDQGYLSSLSKRYSRLNHYEPFCSLKGDFTVVRYEPYCSPKRDFVVVRYEPFCSLKRDFTVVRYEPYCSLKEDITFPSSSQTLASYDLGVPELRVLLSERSSRLNRYGS